MIKPRKMRWTGLVACKGERRNGCRVSVGKPEGKRQLGRPTQRCEDYKMDCREIGWDCMDWIINLAHDRGQ
jgi:hypothetical protein